MFNSNNNSYQGRSGQSRISLKSILNTLVTLVLLAGIFYLGHYATSEIKKLKIDNKLLVQEKDNLSKELTTLKSTNAILLQEKTELVAQIEAIGVSQKEAELKQSGINTQTVGIKKILLASSWDVATFNYTLVAAYLTPIVSDLENLESDIEITDMHFLMVEVLVKDSRTSGNSIKIPINDYLEIINGSLSTKPFTSEDEQIEPGKGKTLYIGFAVPPSNYLFELRAGNLSNPETTELNFADEKVQDLSGVFMLKKGFAVQYSE
jgi:hypothetical protein